MTAIQAVNAETSAKAAREAAAAAFRANRDDARDAELKAAFRAAEKTLKAAQADRRRFAPYR